MSGVFDTDGTVKIPENADNAEDTDTSEKLANSEDTEEAESARRRIFERDFELWRERIFSEIRAAEEQEQDYGYTGSLPGFAAAALSLIVMGVLLFADFFTDNAGNALRFSPFMLVFLGVETAVWLFRRRGKANSVNAKQIIVPAAVIAAAVVLMITAGHMKISPKTAQEAEIAEQRRLDFPRISAGERVSADLENLFYPKLKNLGIIESFRVRTEIYSGQIQPNPEYADFTADYAAYTGRKDLRPGDRTYAHVKLKGISTTDAQFAAEARKAVRAISTESFLFDEILITTSQKGVYRAVKLDGKYELNPSAEEIERRVSYLIDGEAEDLETLPDVEDLILYD